MDGGAALTRRDLLGDGECVLNRNRIALVRGLACEPGSPLSLDAAASMPTTWPLLSVKGPPESPG